MNHPGSFSQRGQSLVLFALMIIAFLAIAALVFDGGMTFAKRREAQNAADAAALAGARTLCLYKSGSLAESDARYYAARNGAQSADVNVSLENRMVNVTVSIPVTSTLAGLLGWERIPVQASASAGCFSPTFGEGVLPVAWACRPPVIPEISDSGDCEEQWLYLQQSDTVPITKTLQHHLDNPPPNPPGVYPELYIIMDSQSTPEDLTQTCQSLGGWLDCDLDNDGEDDLIANGDRAWLDLNGGGGGSSELVDWVNGQNVPPLEIHKWLNGQPGTATNVYHAAEDLEGHFVIVPVFDQFCDKPPETGCPGKVHTEDIILESYAGGNYYYHIITFAAFYITCVNSQGPECPGHKAARDLGVFASIPGSNASNPKTIEGYFIKGYIKGLEGGPGGPNIDTGAYTFYLIR